MTEQDDSQVQTFDPRGENPTINPSEHPTNPDGTPGSNVAAKPPEKCARHNLIGCIDCWAREAAGTLGQTPPLGVSPPQPPSAPQPPTPPQAPPQPAQQPPEQAWPREAPAAVVEQVARRAEDGRIHYVLCQHLASGTVKPADVPPPMRLVESVPLARLTPDCKVSALVKGKVTEAIIVEKHWNPAAMGGAGEVVTSSFLNELGKTCVPLVIRTRDGNLTLRWA